MTRYYISGPISNHDPAIVARNKAAFHAAHVAIWRRTTVVSIFNPVQFCKQVEELWRGTDQDLWRTCMRMCLRELADCEEIVMLPGHETSRGAQLELHNAKEIGMPVWLLDGLLEQERRV